MIDPMFFCLRESSLLCLYSNLDFLFSFWDLERCFSLFANKLQWIHILIKTENDVDNDTFPLEND